MYAVVRNLHRKEDDLLLPYLCVELTESLNKDFEILREFESEEKAQALTLKCNEIKVELLSPHDHQCALWSQEACNLSGIVFEFSNIMKKICREAELFGHGTEWKNSHPICRLYAEQIENLSRKADWKDAWDYCERRKP